MEFISVKQAAEKWNVSERRVQIYAKEGRIAGAKTMGRTWMIPADAVKPADIRRKKESRPYRFPFLLGGNYTDEEIENTFTDEEKRMLYAEKISAQDRKAESNPIFTELAENSTNEFLVIEAYYNLVYNYAFMQDEKNHVKYLTLLREAVKNVSSHKQDLEALLYDAEIFTLGYDNPYRHFQFDPSYCYSREALNVLAVTDSYLSIIKSLSDPFSVNPLSLMIIAETAEQDGYLFYAHLLYIQISIMCLNRKNEKGAVECFRKAFGIAKQKEYYTYIAQMSYLAPLVVGRVTKTMSGRDMDFLSKIIDGGYSSMITKKGTSELFAHLTKGEYKLLSYAIWKQTISRIAKEEGCSVTTITNRYTALYDKLGVSNKTELVKKCIENIK